MTADPSNTDMTSDPYNPPPPRGESSARSTDPRLFVAVAVSLVLLIAIGIGVVFALLGDRSESPSPTFPAADDGANGDPLSNSTGTGDASPQATTSAPPLPEPFQSLGAKPVEGCTTGCLDNMSFEAALAGGVRETTLRVGDNFTVRVTVNNPTRFSGVLTKVGSPQVDYALQPPTGVDGLPPCPAVGDPPLLLAPNSTLVCERTLKVTDRYPSGAEFGVEYEYLSRAAPGDPLERQTGGLRSGPLSQIQVTVTDG